MADLLEIEIWLYFLGGEEDLAPLTKDYLMPKVMHAPSACTPPVSPMRITCHIHTQNATPYPQNCIYETSLLHSR
jgi:hypothetical protein